MASRSVHRYAAWRGVDERDAVDVREPRRARPTVSAYWCNRTAGCLGAKGHDGDCITLMAPF